MCKTIIKEFSGWYKVNFWLHWPPVWILWWNFVKMIYHKIISTKLHVKFHSFTHPNGWSSLFSKRGPSSSKRGHIHAYSYIFNRANMIYIYSYTHTLISWDLPQFTWSLWVILEGSWLCEATVEKKAGAKNRGCRNCCSFRSWMLCLVLCWRDCRTRFYDHWLPCLTVVSAWFWRINILKLGGCSLLFVQHFGWMIVYVYLLEVFAKNSKRI